MLADYGCFSGVALDSCFSVGGIAVMHQIGCAEAPGRAEFVCGGLVQVFGFGCLRNAVFCAGIVQKEVAVGMHDRVADEFGNLARAAVDRGSRRGSSSGARWTGFVQFLFAAVSIRRSAALERKARVVLNGVNTSVFFPREECREPKTIFFVGSFIAAKGPLQLVEAYSRVLATHPDAKLIVAGSTSFGRHEETEYVRSVRELARSIEKQHGVSIEFPGYIHHDRELPAFFQRATLFASPSIFQEPFGLVNAEAMACATPVVGSNRGGIPDVLGDTGRLIDPEDVAQYAEALSELLSDSEERLRLGRAALERCRKTFDWNVIAKTWRDYLLQVTGARMHAVECA